MAGGLERRSLFLILDTCVKKFDCKNKVKIDVNNYSWGRFFRNGNFTGLSQALMCVIGFSMIFGVLWFQVRSRWLVMTFIITGLFLMSVGCFSARAQLSGLWVFGEPDWKKAKRTYQDNNEKTQAAPAARPDEDKG